MKEARALAGGARRLSAREEELLGLLAGIPDGGGSDRELSFSDFVEAGADADLGGATKAPREDRPCAEAAAAALSSPGRREAAAAALSSPGRREALAAASKRQRQRARRSGGSRGSCGGGDGVLLNFYVPGLLTRSVTTPRPSRGPPSPGAVQRAPAKPVAAAAAGKASRTKQTALGIGCWSALWGRGRRPAKACS